MPEETVSVETWQGERTVTVRSRGSYEEAEGRQCALCGDDASDIMAVRHEWLMWLMDERDFTPPAGGDVATPLCVECEVRVDYLNEGEKELGLLPEEQQSQVESEREAVLSELSLEHLFSRPSDIE